MKERREGAGGNRMQCVPGVLQTVARSFDSVPLRSLKAPGLLRPLAFVSALVYVQAQV